MASKKSILTVCLVLCLLMGYKQTNAQADSTKKLSYSLLPVLVSDPFIGFGYGVLTNVNFLLGAKETTRFSNAQAYVINTTNGQFAAQFNHQIFTNNESWIWQGKLQYLNWPENTYGLGSNTQNDVATDKEKVSYQAIELEERILRKLKTHHFLGLQYRLYNCWNIKSDKDTLSFFENNAIGTKQFTASTIGVHYIFDSRDNVQNAYKGKYLEIGINPYTKALGSTQDWINMRLDARYYHQFKTTRNLVFANRIMVEQALGNVPYMIMPQTGRLFTTRGYVQGRYRGKMFLHYEAELRAHLWKFIGGVAFVGVNTLSEPNDEIKYINPNMGAGLRFNINKTQRTNIRVDYAFGLNNNSGLYFQICEVF